MWNVVKVPLTPERKTALLGASVRLGKRLEFALEGIPAMGVPFAPPWAEDPRVLTNLLARVDNALNMNHEYMRTV